MPDVLVLSLDGMGGDYAPRSVMEGAALAVKSLPKARFLIYGDETKLRPLLAEQPVLKNRTEIRHTDVVVAAGDKPSSAVRRGKNSSMRLAIDAVRDGEAHAVVSAGNTGALMAMAMFSLRTLPEISRPAIVAEFPTMGGSNCVLDLGANVECTANNLVQFAVMGEMFARTVMEVDKPSVALLNIGVEELKGREEVKQAATMLRESHLPLDFQGFVEGDDIAKGTVNVIVTDGYTGNVALKTAEGTAHLIRSYIRDAFSNSLLGRLGFLFAVQEMRRLRKRLDPRRYNGAVLAGLNGIVVKSHGGTDKLGFAHAIGVAADLVTKDYLIRMERNIETMQTELMSTDTETE